MNKENNQRLGGSANDPPKRFPIFPLMPDDVFVNKSGKILNEENLFNTELASKLPKDVKVLMAFSPVTGHFLLMIRGESWS